jgi:cytoskeletal protein CcmA (bactofilin family)
MREERGRLAGNQIVAESIELWGSIAGNVTVVEGGKLYVRGAVYGDITVEDGGRVHVFGIVQGHLIVREGAKVIHSGTVGKDVINDGGRLVVDALAKVMGKIKTKSGETKLEGKHRA